MSRVIRLVSDSGSLGGSEREIDIEWRKCKFSLRYYLEKYVVIQDRVHQKLTLWKPWPHLLGLVRLVQDWRDAPIRNPLSVIIAKSRQVGATTTVCGIASWLAYFHESTKVEEQSETGDVALEMLARNRFIHEHHPWWLRYKLFPDQDNIMGIPATHGKIVAMPSTPGAGRTSDATMVLCDEWERHPYAEESYASMRPTMAKGGLFIGLSTIDKMKSDTFFKKVWAGAVSGKNNFIPIFWGYYSVPGRDESTYQRDTAGMADWMREGEYPRTENELLTPPKAVGYFNHDILEKILHECSEPIEERYGGKVKIYKSGITSRKFVMAVDSSEGRDDPSVGIVADGQTDEDVACFHGKMSLEEQAKYTFELYREYNEPLLAVERNASGLTLIEKLNNLGVKNWYYSDAKERKPGWYTASNGINRDRILQELAEEVHLRRKRIPMKDCILQFFDFAWVNGRPEAIRGKHDDWVMCEAILNQVRKNIAQPIKVTTATYKPKEPGARYAVSSRN